MRKPKEESYKTGEKALTYEQVQKLLSQVGIPLQEEALLRLALDGGLRREDIVGVRRPDVKLEESQVLFYEHKKRRNWQVFLEPATMKALSQAMAASSGIWLFPAANQKKHIASRTAYNILQRNLLACGVESKPFHALRSTCMKLKQKAGWPVEMTAKHTGDTIRVVQEHYLTPSLEEMREKVQHTNLFGEAKGGA
jgi:integrase